VLLLDYGVLFVQGIRTHAGPELTSTFEEKIMLLQGLALEKGAYFDPKLVQNWHNHWFLLTFCGDSIPNVMSLLPKERMPFYKL